MGGADAEGGGGRSEGRRVKGQGGGQDDGHHPEA